MLSFESDYCEGAHEDVLRALLDTNREQMPGYGADRFTARAKEKIRAACGCPEADMTLLVGGTQTNAVVISTVLQPFEGVLAADTGHVNAHEAGAIEYTGHKVLTLPHRAGKLAAADVRAYLRTFYADANHEHMVFPGMVYLSHPTEYGTLYTRAELEALAAVCREYRLPLYLDGARLGYGLAAPGTDVTLAVLAQCCDVFYIGGTKVGALCGEAVVFPHGGAPAHFLTQVKQHGALLAKGRLLGVQFDALFTDGLYERMGRHAMEQAQRLQRGFAQKGYRFALPPETNQLFVVLENARMAQLAQQVAFNFWEKADETHTVVRFATSWATRPEDVDTLLALL